MWLGINYPWLNYGWDFGKPPSGWHPRAQWRTVLAEHLAELRRVGIRVVRWFVVADGLLYGTGAGAPHRVEQQWRFAPPRVSAELLDDFSALLEVFHETQFLLLPVFVDFHFAKQGQQRDRGYMAGGRAMALSEASARRQLFSGLLVPLLERSQSRSRSIYAWDLINEPEGCTDTGHSDRGEFPNVPLPEMMDFLREGTRLIADYGFRSTIGYRHPATPIRWDGIASSRRRAGSMRALPRLPPSLNPRPFGEHYWQFHYYPSLPTPDGFPPRSEIMGTRSDVILGEFTTTPARDEWPVLGTDQSTTARLAFARDHGVALAMPWSFRAKLRADSLWSGPDATNAAALTGDDRAAVDWPTLAAEISAFTGGAW